MLVVWMCKLEIVGDHLRKTHHKVKRKKTEGTNEQW